MLAWSYQFGARFHHSDHAHHGGVLQASSSVARSRFNPAPPAPSAWCGYPHPGRCERVRLRRGRVAAMQGAAFLCRTRGCGLAANFPMMTRRSTPPEKARQTERITGKPGLTCCIPNLAKPEERFQLSMSIADFRLRPRRHLGLIRKSQSKIANIAGTAQNLKSRNYTEADDHRLLLDYRFPSLWSHRAPFRLRPP